MVYFYVIAIYLGILVGVSYYKSRSIKTQEDFMVAGRVVPWYLLVGTLVSTWIGSGSLFAGAGRAYREGFSALWMSAGAWVGIAIVYFLAGKVRKIAQFTVPDILEKRYHPSARLLGTIAIIIAYLTIASYQFIGGGRLLNLLFPDLDPVYAKAIIAGLVVLYTVMAGMSSIVAIDVLNGLMIIISIIIAAPLVLKGAGGWAELTTTLPSTHFDIFGRLGLLPALGLFFPTFFLLLGESSIYQKFFSAKDAKSARKAVIGMIVGVLIIETLMVVTSIFGAGIYWNDPNFVGNGETILLQIARYNLPMVAGLLLLTGAVAIIFSTANTFLMVPSTNLTRDVYQRFINPDIIEMHPVSRKLFVFCKNLDGAKTARKVCTKACIACSICVRNVEEGQMVMEDNLAIVNYDIFGKEAKLPTDKCPTDCLAIIGPPVVDKPAEKIEA